ncbi:MAG: RNA polymerase sigma factor [Bacteroidetes bacterium]|nr:RNA polymerase sigma factor [Bacteroidota bacterium]
MPEWDDREIIEGAGTPGREEQSFNHLVLKYQERLYWHIRKIVISHEDADDVMQNTLLKVWKALPGFRSESGLFTWLYRIATNESLTLLKQKKRRAFAPWVDVEQRMADQLKADPFFDGNEASLKLQKAILALPEKQRIVFNMKYFDEMKYEEMSGILDTSVGALKASYHHAVKKLENMLGDD